MEAASVMTGRLECSFLHCEREPPGPQWVFDGEVGSFTVVGMIALDMEGVEERG